MSEIVKIQLRRGLSAEWSAQNPKLSKGEIGIDFSSKSIKIGDGISHWLELESLTKYEDHHPFSFLG